MTILKIISFSFLWCSILPIIGQEYNPYERFDKDVKVLTFSNGKYNEFFDTDTIEIIGSAVLNTKTMKVIGFIDEEVKYSESTLEPEVVSRWLSLDPLAAKYPSMSPYNFVGNSPILFIDPDGRDIRVWAYDRKTKKDVYVVLNERNIAEYANNQGGPHFLRGIAKSIQYIIDIGGGDNLLYLLRSDQTTDIISEPLTHNTAGTTIYFDIYSGIATDRGIILSPATILEHEATHRANRIKNVKEMNKRLDAPDKDYSNKEEKLVITTSEQKTALANGEIRAGEVTRKNHNGAKVILKSGVTSTEVDEEATKSYYQKYKQTYHPSDVKRIKKVYDKNKIKVN